MKSAKKNPRLESRTLQAKTESIRQADPHTVIQRSRTPPKGPPKGGPPTMEDAERTSKRMRDTHGGGKDHGSRKFEAHGVREKQAEEAPDDVLAYMAQHRENRLKREAEEAAAQPAKPTKAAEPAKPRPPMRRK